MMTMLGDSLAITPNGNLVSDDRNTPTFSGLVGVQSLYIILVPKALVSESLGTRITPAIVATIVQLFIHQ